ncbi:MAG: hypothetical protein CMI09_16500 [Oceanospirillaceae bacterium]|nr:hypothetical protein [Oceanospirillaceae bacterium]|tara:strand:- start:228 stop:440 length:213 start_codon:yes stop_codon:yes gene_type:complete
MTDRILRRQEVQQLVGLPRSTLYARIAAGEFPKSIKLGGPNSRSVGWRESVIQKWIEDQAEANHQHQSAA